MNRSKAIKIAASTIAAVMLLSSCTPIGKMQQNGWIKKLGKAFPDDTFTFDGHPQEALSGTDYSTVKVKSELYPDAYISLWQQKGELCTTYHALAYEKDIFDEMYRIIDGRFPCSSYVINKVYQDSYKGYPVEDIGTKKFIKDYMDYKCQVFLFCDDESQIPGDEEIKELFYDLIEDEPHIYTLQLYYFDAKDTELAKDAPLKYYKVRYQLFMTKEDYINNIYADFSGGTENDHYIVRNGHDEK